MFNFIPQAETKYSNDETAGGAAVAHDIAAVSGSTHVVKGVYIYCDQPPANGLAIELTANTGVAGAGTDTNTFWSYYSKLDSGKYIPFPDGFYGNEGDAIRLDVATDAAVIRTVIAYQ